MTECIQNTNQGHDSAFAMCNEMNLGICVIRTHVLIDFIQSLPKRIQDRLTLNLKLNKNLYIINVVTQDSVQIKFEYPGRLGDVAQSLQHRHRLNHLAQHYFYPIVFLAGTHYCLPGHNARGWHMVLAKALDYCAGPALDLLY